MAHGVVNSSSDLLTVANEAVQRSLSCPTEWIKKEVNKSSQGWMKLRSTVQLSGAIQKTKHSLKREDSFLKRFSTRQAPENQETVDDGDGGSGSQAGVNDSRRRLHRKKLRQPRTFVNPDDSFYFRWLTLVTTCVLYNLWTLIVRQSFPELQEMVNSYWIAADMFSDLVYLLDIFVQLRTGYLEQGLMVYDSRKLAAHYFKATEFSFDILSLTPLDLLQFYIGINPIIRFPRFLKVYRAYNFYYMVESRTVYPNLWRVVNLIHILLILAHWFGCFYFLLSEAEKFQGDWVYPYRPGEYATLTRKYLGSLYWSTLTLTTIGDLPTPETNADKKPTDGLQTLPRRGHKSRLLQFHSNRGYLFTIASYLIGVFIFATIVGQVGNVITNRNANRLEFERLLDGAKTYMRHHKVPGGMKRRVLRWYDYSWSRGRIQGGGDINTALGLLPDKLKTELALHVNLSVLKKVTIFHECQPEFLHDLVLKMKAYIFTPGDLICRKGEIAREMFIIADGILEVTSETGRILTTMQAGDFFGEIGILNLDGLNRRTADVRSVGYSELFSLSREDVLTAMRDYPEAQEILLALGTKRLMEARNMNRNSKRRSQLSPEGLFDHDGLKNKSLCSQALLSNEESESSEDGSQSNRNASMAGTPGRYDATTGKKIVDTLKSGREGLKNVLRRSRKESRTKEDDIELQPLTTNEDGRHTRECRGELSRMARVRSDDTSLDEGPSTSPPQDTAIGAGLPLLQRLKLLKEKQEKEGVERNMHVEVHVLNERESKVMDPLLHRDHLKQKEGTEREAKTIQTTASETAQVLASTVRTQLMSTLLLRPTRSQEEEHSLRPNLKSPPALEPKETSCTRKSAGVSWKDSFSQDERNTGLLVSDTIQRSNVGEDRNADQTNITTSPQIKIYTDSSHQNINIISLHDRGDLRLPVHTGTQSYFERLSSLERSEHNEISVGNSPESIKFAQDLKDAQKNSISNDNNPSISSQFAKYKESVCMDAPSEDELKSFREARISREKPLSLRFKAGNKIYKSIDDLSPECSDLPFVKRLKILNERQKNSNFAHLRSSSLDSGHDSRHGKNNESVDSSNLIRSYSETLAFEVALQNQQQRAQGKAELSEVEQTFQSPDSNLVSPESNETFERRKLKSILKKLSSASSTTSTTPPEFQTASSNSSTEFKKLMRAQTVEGYAARHSKLSKSVTFNRDTLESPPHDPTSNNQESVYPFAKFSLSLDTAESGNQVTRDTPHCSKDILVTNVNLRESLTTSSGEKFQGVFDTVIANAGTQTDLIDSLPTGTPHSPRFECTEGSDIPTGSCAHCSASDTQTRQRNLNFAQRPQGNFFGRPQAKQKNFYRPGSVLLPTCEEEDEFFGGLLNGIKDLIKKHLEEVQSQFQTRFYELEMEVRDRDDAILDLQSQIYSLENSELQISGVQESSGAYFMREGSVDTVLRHSSHCSGHSWEEPSVDGNSFHMGEDSDHMEDHRLLHDFEDEDHHCTGCFDEEALDSLNSSDEEKISFIQLSEDEEDSEEIVTKRPIPTHPFESFTATDIESYSSDSENEGHMFPPGGHNDWEVRMLAAEMDRRESLQRRKARMLRSLSSGSRKGAVSHTCQGRCGRKQSTEGSLDNEQRSSRRPPLVTAKSLDEHSGPRDPLPLSERSISFGNFQSTVSSSSGSSGVSFAMLFLENELQASRELTSGDTALTIDTAPTEADGSKSGPSPNEKSLQPPKF